MDLTEKQISFEYKFKGKIVNLRVDDALLPNGATAKISGNATELFFMELPMEKSLKTA